MDKKRFRCASCKKLKALRTENQRYCNDPTCQKERKNAWRREKYATDADYRANQKKSTQTYLQSVGGAAAYYKTYRQRKKEKLTPKIISKINGKQTACAKSSPPLDSSTKDTLDERVHRETPCWTANSDATFAKTPLIHGRYLLKPAGETRHANSDAFLVEITVIT